MLTTARLRLRLWRNEDLEPYAALNADPRVREFFPSLQTHQESADSRQFIREHWRRHGFGLWAVEVIDRSAARLLGTDDTSRTSMATSRFSRLSRAR